MRSGREPFARNAYFAQAAAFYISSYVGHAARAIVLREFDVSAMLAH